MTAVDATRTSMIERVDAIFRAFTDTDLSLTLQEIARRADIPPSSAHRILEQMGTTGWIQRVGDRYRLGLALFELGGLARSANRIHGVCAPMLQELHRRTGQVVHLAVTDGTDALYLDKVGGRFAGKVPTRIGGRQPLRVTAIGKAMLAFAGPERIEEIVGADLVPRTSRTIIDPDAVRRELDQIRTDQIAYDAQESFTGLACVAAPIRGAGRAVAAVSICGPASAVDFIGHAPLVREAAAAIWREAFGD